MGRAKIVSHAGGGLYTATLAYNTDSLDKALSPLIGARDAYAEKILNAIDTRQRLLAARDDARIGMDAVIEQWLEGVISATEEEPPNLDLDDPGSLVEVEQPIALLAAINAQRTSGVTRNEALAGAIRALLGVLAASGRTTDINSTPERRATMFGYSYDTAHGVALVLQFGATSAQSAVERMMRSPSNAGAIQDAHWVDAGVGYLYAPRNHYSYLWGALLAAPGGTAEVIRPDSDPATEAAEAAGAELERITVPQIDTFQPRALGEACAAYGRSVAAYRAADETVERLKVEQSERLKQIGRLEQLKNHAASPVDVWSCQSDPVLRPGQEVVTAEVNGWYAPGAVNIVPAALLDAQTGQLRYAETLSDAMVFFNLALEPGHVKWRPRWRYATITAVEPSGCDLALFPTEARGPDDLGRPGINADLTLEGVRFNYLPCQDLAFRVGDEVLVEFAGHDRGEPQVVGFRKHPRGCRAFLLASPRGVMSLLCSGQRQTSPTLAAGNRYWTGPDGRVVSWSSTTVYMGGAAIWTASGSEIVYCAALREFAGVDSLVVIAGNSTNIVATAVAMHALGDGAGTIIGTIPRPDDGANADPPYRASSGTWQLSASASSLLAFSTGRRSMTDIYWGEFFGIVWVIDDIFTSRVWRVHKLFSSVASDMSVSPSSTARESWHTYAGAQSCTYVGSIDALVAAYWRGDSPVVRSVSASAEHKFSTTDRAWQSTEKVGDCLCGPMYDYSVSSSVNMQYRRTVTLKDGHTTIVSSVDRTASVLSSGSNSGVFMPSVETNEDLEECSTDEYLPPDCRGTSSGSGLSEKKSTEKWFAVPDTLAHDIPCYGWLGTTTTFDGTPSEDGNSTLVVDGMELTLATQPSFRFTHRAFDRTSLEFAGPGAVQALYEQVAFIGHLRYVVESYLDRRGVNFSVVAARMPAGCVVMSAEVQDQSGGLLGDEGGFVDLGVDGQNLTSAVVV